MSSNLAIDLPRVRTASNAAEPGRARQGEGHMPTLSSQTPRGHGEPALAAEAQTESGADATQDAPESGAGAGAGVARRLSLARAASFSLLGALCGSGCALAIWVAATRPYTSGSDLGYYMGLVGGLLMLFLLSYSLRKHSRKLAQSGPMRTWFKMHMLFGVGGPLLILFHSTFQAGSLNGKVALYSMLLVAASGVVGRFVYVRIHHGLYGRQATLREREAQLAESTETLRAAMERAPRIREMLDEYRVRAIESSVRATSDGFWQNWRFLAVPLMGARVRSRVRREFRRVLRATARHDHWSKRRYLAERRAARVHVTHYMRAVDDVALFTVWERVFALWHVAHVPLVYLLILSGVAHVVAVHMY